MNKDFDNNIPDFTKRKKALKLILFLLVISLIILVIQLFFKDSLSFSEGNLTIINSFIAFILLFLYITLTADMYVTIKRIKERVYVVEFFGKDNALIIGQKGKTLNSFEYILNSMIKNCRIEIDVERFKEKRNETLRILAKRMAEKVSKYGKTVRLNAMPPRERG